jgi:hypothetical protein
MFQNLGVETKDSSTAKEVKKCCYNNMWIRLREVINKYDFESIS